MRQNKIYFQFSGNIIFESSLIKYTLKYYRRIYIIKNMNVNVILK